MIIKEKIYIFKILEKMVIKDGYMDKNIMWINIKY